MSFDRQIDQVCPHLVAEEALFISPSDRMTVRPIRPIASANSVAVRLNGAIDVPSSGTLIAAESISALAGPFDIRAGINNTMAISIDSGPLQTFDVPVTGRIPAPHLADLLNRAFRGLVFEERKDRIRFFSQNVGPSASIYIAPTSTLAPVLGIRTSREWRGKQTAPGWTLVSDPNTLNDRPTRLIVFDTPLPGFQDYVEINYVTLRQECRRCGGLGIENDWRYGNTGDTGQVRDEALLIQELLKDFYTLQGSNAFHLWYGTNLIETIGKKLAAGGFVQNLIVSEIYTAFKRWQSVKKQQEEAVGQFVSDEEFPFRLLAVDMQQSTQDPTVVFISMTVQNRSGKEVDLQRGLKLPQPLDLLGSTSQQGVFRQSLSNFVLTG